MVALVVAVVPRTDDAGESGRENGRVHSTISQQSRAAAGLADCPPESAPGAGPLAGLVLECLADGEPVDVAAVLAGKPALVNLWAHWCAPCARELPYLQQYARRAGNAITVLTVHSDPDGAKALSRLRGLQVTLPGLLDAEASVRTAVGAQAVLPLSVLLRSDGSVAEVVVRAFDSVEDIADTVAVELGVTI
ncbi:TlpA disulfide reductase family protein [Nocardia sp. CNY236]|uniref:TlpA family protein disulfide reductase n=1 Tax=Nocardia sp. CNY236 TaxID=1169152 RepID=UPI0006877B75|nr:TlpA disulfide reductase family protein [Nocardia sp. CNY236]